MISIIICSTKPEQTKILKDNFNQTIGYDHEFIVFDNSVENWGLCKVYNYCAEKANGKYLCFVHQDVKMLSKNWGNVMVDFIKRTPNCGVIGFAGGRYVAKNHTTWLVKGYTEENYYISLPTMQKIEVNPLKKDFSPVVLLDGYFLFCHQAVWEKVRFDEETFQGFHFYDMDFTMRTTLESFQNYVCHTVEPFHDSLGSYNISYYDYAAIFRQKYAEKLPFFQGKKNMKTAIVAEIVSISQMQKLTSIDIEYKKRLAEELKNRNGTIRYYFYSCIIHFGKKIKNFFK